MLPIEECRKEFETYVITVSLCEIAPHVLERTSGAPGMIRDYKDQETELMWRAFKYAYFLK